MLYSGRSGTSADIFAGRIGQYVLTSTLSVYDFADHPVREEDFDPYRYPVMMNESGDYSYKEGKRQAEAVLFGRHNLNVTAVRLPIVLGPDDYTRRLHFHIEHATRGEAIGLPDPDAQISFVHAEEAGVPGMGRSSSVGGPSQCLLQRNDFGPGIDEPDPAGSWKVGTGAIFGFTRPHVPIWNSGRLDDGSCQSGWRL